MSGMTRFRLGLAILILSIGSTSALEVTVSFGSGGQEARVGIRQVPSVEPLGALRIKVRFREATGSGAMSLFRPQEGPWSQIQPELRRDGRTAEILALAPAIGVSRSLASETVAELAVALPPGSQAAEAGDVVDSVWIEEALLPWGGKSQVTYRLTTSSEVRRARFQDMPVERVLGIRRTISFTLSKESKVRVRVLDPRGSAVVKVFDGRMGRGMHEITWDGHGTGGKRLAGGTYFLRLEAGAALTYDRKLEVAP